jgi:hypothetical protein
MTLPARARRRAARRACPYCFSQAFAVPVDGRHTRGVHARGAVLSFPYRHQERKGGQLASPSPTRAVGFRCAPRRETLASSLCRCVHRIRNPGADGAPRGQCVPRIAPDNTVVAAAAGGLRLRRRRGTGALSYRAAPSLVAGFNAAGIAQFLAVPEREERSEPHGRASMFWSLGTSTDPLAQISTSDQQSERRTSSP